MIQCSCDERRDELAALLRGLSEADVPRFDCEPGPETAYCRHTIHRDEHHEVAAARWAAGRSCVLHGHSQSAVLIRILSGTLIEERYLRDHDGVYRYETAILRAGCTSYLPVGAYHRLFCEEEAATVHAFGPTPANPVSRVPPHLIEIFHAAKQRVLYAGRQRSVNREPQLNWR